MSRIAREVGRQSRQAAPIEAGVRVRTNALFLELFQTGTTRPWTGVAVERHEPVAGCWKIRVDGLERPQFLNEKFLEVES